MHLSSAISRKDRPHGSLTSAGQPLVGTPPQDPSGRNLMARCLGYIFALSKVSRSFIVDVLAGHGPVYTR